MATTIPAKSILKQSSSAPKPTLSDEERAKVERDRRNLGIALHHAKRIQYQKDIQAQILSNIEDLVDFPVRSISAPSEASHFTSLIQPFQPSDFDSLVEERHVAGRCGYGLCDNAPRSVSMGPSAAWKLKGQGAEYYCRNDCLRMALHVKSQLSEVPAWEREHGQQPQIVLSDETVPSPRPNHNNANRFEDQSAAQNELALERGETASSFRPGQVMTAKVVEKPTVAHKPPADVKTSHTAIEGYEPTLSFERESDAMSLDGSLAEGLVAGNADLDIQAFEVESDEREAWQDLFDNINKR